MYSCGSNSHGQLCQQHNNDINTVTYSNKLQQYNIQELYCGGTYCIGINSNNTYIIGNNIVNNDDSDIHNDWQLIHTGAVQSVVCSWQYVGIIDTDNNVIIYGYKYTVFTPVTIPTQYTVQYIACTYTQLYIVVIDQIAEQQHLLCYKLTDLTKYTCIDIKVVNGTIQRIVAGFKFILLITQNNQLYGLGNNTYNQLSTTDTAKHSTLIPIHIELHVNEHIIDVQCGWSHTLLLTSQHRVYTWGRNNFGQCGFLHSQRTITIPTEIQLPTNQLIVQIAAGSEHTMLLTDTNNVHVTGWNEHGNLGLRHNTSVSQWTQIDSQTYDNHTIKQIHAAGAATYVIV